MKKLIVAAACAALVATGACRKVGDGQVEYEKPVVGTTTDTATVPTVDVKTDSTTVKVPKVVTDTATVKVPKIQVNTPSENKAKNNKKKGE